MKHSASNAKTAITATIAGIAMLFTTACTTSQVSQGGSPYSGSTNTTQTSASKPPNPPPIAYSIVSISDIYALWDRNQIAAIDKYNNKPTQIDGVVNGIYNDGAGRLEIEDRNDWSGLGITCNINSSQRSKLGRLSHGDSVTIHGTLELTNGLFDTREIEMKGCKVGSAQNVASQYQQAAPSSNSSPPTRHRASPPKPQIPHSGTCSFNGAKELCVVEWDTDGTLNVTYLSDGKRVSYEFRDGKGKVYDGNRSYNAAVSNRGDHYIFTTQNGQTVIPLN